MLLRIQIQAVLKTVLKRVKPFFVEYKVVFSNKTLETG